MTLPTNYADGNTIHGADLNNWDVAINALLDIVSGVGSTLVAGMTSTVTSVSTITLTVASTGVQVLTGSTAQTVALPTTSVTVGMAWVVINNSSQTATVTASGGATVQTVTAGNVGIYRAMVATPTTAAGWNMPLLSPSASSVLQGYTSQNSSGTPFTLTPASTNIQVFFGSTIATVTLPSTGVPSGFQFFIDNDSSATLTVNASDASTILVMAGVTTAVFWSEAANPTANTSWDYVYNGVAVASGKKATVSNTVTLTGTDGKTYSLDPLSLLSASITANAATTSTTNTKIMSLTVPANVLAVGSTFEGVMAGVQSAAGTVTGNIHVGVNNTTADTVVTTLTNLPAITGTTMGFFFRFLLTVRSTGSGGTCIAEGQLTFRLSTTAGYGNASITTATQTVNTTVQNFITLSAAASAGTFTAYTAAIRQIV